MFQGFFGEYHHTIDAKNRVMVPAKFRDAFKGKKGAPKFYVTCGPDKCLMLYTPTQWQHWDDTLEKLTDVRSLSKDVRDFLRMIYASTHQVTCDRLGRILVPQPLVDYAGLKEDVVVTGVRTRMEIWSKEKWAKRRQLAGTKFEKSIENIFK